MRPTVESIDQVAGAYEEKIMELDRIEAQEAVRGFKGLVLRVLGRDAASEKTSLARRYNLPLDVDITRDVAYRESVDASNIEYDGDQPETRFLSRRIMASQNLALWYLLVTHPDQLLYEMDREEFDGMVAEYLEGVSTREERWYKNPLTPSLGLEVEFIVRSGGQIDELRKLIAESAVPIDASLISRMTATWQYLYDVPFNVINEIPSKEGAEPRHVQEIRYDPSASPSTQLRELLTLYKSGRLDASALYVQENIGGIDVGLGKTEPMMLTALMAAANYKESPTELNSPFGYAFENIRKISRRGDQHAYVPFLRRKIVGQGNMISVTQPYKEGFNDIVVEFRYASPAESFSGLVRHVENEWFLCTAIRAVQKRPEDRNASEFELAGVWNEVEQKFTALLGGKGIDPKIDESIIADENDLEFMKKFKPYEEGGEKIPFGEAMAKIEYYSAHDAQFREAARDIVVDARREIRRIVRGTKEQDVSTEES